MYFIITRQKLLTGAGKSSDTEHDRTGRIDVT